MEEEHRLTLFVTSRTPLSERAEANIRKICADALQGHYALEVVDVVAQPERAASHQIVVTPTLVVSGQGGTRRLIGDFSDKTKVLPGLGIEPDASS